MQQKRITLRLREGLKEYLLSAAGAAPRPSSGLPKLTASEIMRRSAEDLLRQDLDGYRFLHLTLCESEFTPSAAVGPYAWTPWTTFTFLIDRQQAAALQALATCNAEGFHQVLRAGLLDFLVAHYPLPPEHKNSESLESFGISEMRVVDCHGKLVRLDPRHPMNEGDEDTAWERLYEIAAGPDPTPEAVELLYEVVLFLAELQREFDRYRTLLPPPSFTELKERGIVPSSMKRAFPKAQPRSA